MFNGKGKYEKQQYRKSLLKKPTSLSRNGVSKSPYHNLPSEQGDWRAYF
jgi:hypothetical protein